MSSNSTLFYNQSSLKMHSGILTQVQAEKAFSAFIKQLQKKFPGVAAYAQAKWEINVVTDTRGKIFGTTYAWVSEPKIYHILIGNNADGTERTRRYPDPKWVLPTSPRPEVTATLGISKSKSWADIAEEEEEIETLYTQPMIEEKLEPIATLPAIEHTPEQIRILEAQRQDTETEVDRYGYFSVYRSRVILPSQLEYDCCVLCCRTAPNWVTVDIMKPYFEPFNTDSSLHEVTINGKQERIKFPQIRIKADTKKLDFEGKPMKNIYVTFSHIGDHVADAAFCLQMRRKFTVKGPAGRSNQLIFSHWRKAVPSGSCKAEDPKENGSEGGKYISKRNRVVGSAGLPPVAATRKFSP